MHASVRRVIRICLGILLILLGIAGLFLPLLQGMLFISAGILLLAPNSRISQWIKRIFRRITAWAGRAVRRAKSGQGRKLRRPFRWLAAKLREKRKPA